MQCFTAWGSGSGPRAAHCLTAWGQWEVEPLQYTASLPGGSGQCNSSNTLPHRLGAVGRGTPAIQCPTAWGNWAVDLLEYTASLPGAVDSGPLAVHCLTAWGQWAVDLLEYTAHPPGCSGQWTSCNTPPHRLWKPGTPAWVDGEFCPGGGRNVL